MPSLARWRSVCDVVVGQDPGQKIAAVERQHGIQRVERFGAPRHQFFVLAAVGWERRLFLHPKLFQGGFYRRCGGTSRRA